MGIRPGGEAYRKAENAERIVDRKFDDDITWRDISSLSRHSSNESIYGDATDVGDDFIESVDNHGILVPLVISKEDVIVSGHRRFSAAQELGFEWVPVVVRQFDDEFAIREAIVEYNRQRDKTYSQRMREADELEAVERERAKRRQGNRTDLRDNCPTSSPSSEYGRTRDKMAELVGASSGRTYSRERKVWKAAKTGDPVAKQEVNKIDRGDSTPSGAWSQVRRRHDVSEDDGESDEGDSDDGTLNAKDIILSAHVGKNAVVFRKVLELHVDANARIADVTYGNGSFWSEVPAGEYELELTDINPDKSPSSDAGVDYRDLPYDDGSIDALVLDPPYAEGFYDSGRSNESDYWIKERYAGAIDGDLVYHEAVLNEYMVAAREARRVLKQGGKLIVKLQDEVSRNEQRLTHIEVTNRYEDMGLTAEDLFVVVREGTPSPGRIKRQRRARKNHSYFMIFVN